MSVGRLVETHMARPSLLLVGLLAGCMTPGLEDFDPAGAEVTGSLEIVGLAPSEGSVAGGTEVMISGQGLSGSVTVWFGTSAAFVSRIDATTVIATTPPAHGEQVVDVRVASDAGEATLPNAFAYMGGDAATEDSDGPLGPTGLVAGVVEFNLVQYACPACMEGRPSEIDVRAGAVFHDPAPMSWLAWLPQSGSCAFNVAPDAPPITPRDAGSQVLLTSGSSSVVLRRTSGMLDPMYLSDPVPHETMLRNASWNLQVPGPGFLGSGELQGVLTTAQGLQTVSPQGLLLNDPNLLFTTPISQSAGQLFSWSPGGSGFFVVEVLSFAFPSGAFEGSVTCVGPDTGAMHVAPTWLQPFSPDASLLVTLYRYQTGEWTDPNSGSVIESINTFGVEGTAYLAP